MIIGVAGYSGSGRNTTARIIQHLIYRNRDNKAQLEWCLTSMNYSMYDCITGWEIKRYRDILIKQSSILLGEPTDKFDNSNFLRSTLPDIWSVKLKRNKRLTNHQFNQWNSKTKLKGLNIVSVQDIMNQIHLHTLEINPDAYNNIMFQFYYPNESKWIIRDVNSQDRIDAIKDRGGFVIFVNRIETGTPLKYDYKVNNNKDFEYLAKQLESILKKERIT